MVRKGWTEMGRTWRSYLTTPSGPWYSTPCIDHSLRWLTVLGLCQMKSLMGSLHKIIPNTLLEWLNILPRKYWLHMISSIAAEQARIRINNSLGSFVCKKKNPRKNNQKIIGGTSTSSWYWYQTAKIISRLGSFIKTW